MKVECSKTDCNLGYDPEQFPMFHKHNTGKLCRQCYGKKYGLKDNVSVGVNVLAKIADDIWAVAEGKAENSENNLKRISGVLHDLRARRGIEWYMK